MKRAQKKTTAMGRPIFRKILKLTLLLTAVEIIILVWAIFGSGLTARLSQNSKDILEERVNNRKNYLENDMVTNWSKLDTAVQAVNKAATRLIATGTVSIDQLNEGSEQSEPLIEDVSDDLIMLLRNNHVTGAYIVLNTKDLDAQQESRNKAGLYLRDLDPISNASEENQDLLVETGPSSVVEKLGISTESCWRPTYNFTNENKYDSFFYEPFQKAYEKKGATHNYKDFGYWSKGYKLHGDGTEVISYSVPLILEDGTVYGVLGIDLTMEYLKKKIPYEEVFEGKVGTYLLAIEEPEGDYQQVFMNGPIYSVDKNATADTTVIKQDAQGNHWIKGEDTDFYCNIQKLNIYNTNTPFSNQQWVLIGAVRETDLFSFSRQIFKTLVSAIVVTLLIGVVGGLFISRSVSKPIAVLYENINAMIPGKRAKFSRSGILEIDRLASAIELLNREVIESSAKFSQIIRMVSVKIGGFEYLRQDGSFFITEGFFNVMGMAENPKNIKEFEQAMNCFLPYIVSEKEGEVLAKIPSESAYIYIKLKYVGESDRYIGVIEDVTQSVMEKERIEHERDYDLLTGLMNRRAFYNRMRSLFETENEKLKTAALLMMDLDNLKTVNDTYGHDLGDKYIRSAASCFCASVPNTAIVSRISGDEFYIFFFGYNSKTEIRQLIQKLQQGIAAQTVFLPNRKQFPIKVSGGIAWYPKDSASYEELFKFADFAMYKTKQTRKGAMNEFDIAVYNRESYLLQNRAELTKILDQSLVEYHFQPIVSVKTGQLFAYEALMRVNMPTLHTPDEVITLARLESKLGLVEELTWTKAMETYEKHVSGHVISKECKIFINSIPNQTLSLEIVERIEKKYAQYLSNIVLEVTESERTDERIQYHKKAILRRWNGAIALDDYGSGYNTEINLLTLEPEYVKIDMEIIRGIDQDSNKQKIVTNIISYAHERGMELVAEGIETQEEARTVISMGVDYLQGYLIGKPALQPPNISEELSAFLKSAYKE